MRKGDVNGDAEGSRTSSSSPEPKLEDGKETKAHKKPRVTLARGRACVACRARKLKCSGDQPCATCQKGGTQCRYEELPRRKPRAVLLEERVSELEEFLRSKGESPPPSALDKSPPGPLLDTSPRLNLKSGARRPSSPDHKVHSSSSTNGRNGLEMSSPMLAGSSLNVEPMSALELDLVHIVLPHTPYIFLPLHPQRFLALLSLPVTDPRRPHPALLYILFAEAIRILEDNKPNIRLPPPPHGFFPPGPDTQIPPRVIDRAALHSQFGGTSMTFLERARAELDQGIRNVDRLFDLLRAAIGIARHLIILGRFIEGFNIPFPRLLIACGLHRQTATILPPNGYSPVGEVLPEPMPPPRAYRHSHDASIPVAVEPALRPLRMRPVVLPPPRDEIDLAERVMTFWAAKMLDWENGVGWGWTISLWDEECTTMWPWGWGIPEVASYQQHAQHFVIEDLYIANSPMQRNPIPDTTFILALKSMAILTRANRLFDHPAACVPPAPSVPPSYIPPVIEVQKVELAIRLLRERIPAPFRHVVPDYSLPLDQVYDGPSDPWWITMHANLLLAEMLTYKEMAAHERHMYERAVSCARAMVELARILKPESFVHIPPIVVLDFSLAARFLNKEAQRLYDVGHLTAAGNAAQEAEVLQGSLRNSVSRWIPMANLHALIIERVKDGLPEKEGEYERV